MQISARHLIGISVTILSAIGLVALLAWIALIPIYNKNGFTRKFSNTELQIVATEESKQNLIGIAGTTSHSIFFKTRKPGKIFMTDKNLRNGRLLTISVPSNKKLESAFYSVVDSPWVYIMAGNGPAVISSTLNGTASKVYRFPTAIFTRAVKISTSSFIFRGFDTTMRKEGQIFIKGNPQTGELLRKPKLTDNSTDKAGIVSDGYLNYDDKTNLLTFVSFYSNRFLCIDTNLNLVYSSNTIDTVHNFQVREGKEKGMITSISAARTINSRIRVSDGKLYTISKLKADNEMTKNFINSAVVDTYDIKSGKYLESFYMPYFNRETIIDYKVLNEEIIAIYKSNVVVFKINHSNSFAQNKYSSALQAGE